MSAAKDKLQHDLDVAGFDLINVPRLGVGLALDALPTTYQIQNYKAAVGNAIYSGPNPSTLHLFVRTTALAAEGITAMLNGNDAGNFASLVGVSEDNSVAGGSYTAGTYGAAFIYSAGIEYNNANGVVGEMYMQGAGRTNIAIGTSGQVFANAGTITESHALSAAPSLITGGAVISFAYGVFVDHQSGGRACGVYIKDSTLGSTGNANIAISTGTGIPAGNWSIYNTSTAANLFNGTLDIDKNTTGNLPAGPTGTLLHIGNANGTTTTVLADGFGGSIGRYSCRQSNGTLLVPTASQSADLLGAFEFYGYGATAYSTVPRAWMASTATENWTDAAQGADIEFLTTANTTTTTTVRFRIDHLGNIVSNASGSAIATGATSPFLYMGKTAGVPTGVPAVSYANNVPAIYDSTNNNFYIYNAGWQLVGGSSSITGAGAANRIATWSGPTALTSNANFTYDGTTFTVVGAVVQNTGAVGLTANAASSFTTSAGALTLTAAAASTWKTSAGALTVDSAAALNLGTTAATSIELGHGAIVTRVTGTLQLGTVSSATGLLKLANSASANLTTIQAGNATAAVTYTLPTADSTGTQYLSSNGSGTLAWGTPAGAAYTFSTGLTNAASTITANLSTGVAGGQSAIGGTGASENLTLSTTSNATKGQILFGSLGAFNDTSGGWIGIGTQTRTSTNYLGEFLGAVNAGLSVSIKNTNATSLATSQFQVINDAGSTLQLTMYGSAYTSGTFDRQAGSAVVNTGAGGMSLGAADAAGVLRMYAGGVANANETLRLDANKNVFVGGNNSPAALATNATNGWLYLTASAGAPTGVPATTPTGRYPIQYDSTNNKLWVYNGGWAIPASFTFSTGLTNTSGTVTANITTGLAGGQSAVGGTAASENLTLSSTSNATKGQIKFGTLGAFNETSGGWIGVGTQTRTSVNYLEELIGSVNAGLSASIKNTSATSLATSQFQVINDGGSTLQLTMYGSAYTSGTFDVQAGSAVVNTGAGGMSLGAADANGVLRMYAGGVANANETLRLDQNKNVFVGGNNSPAALATNATNGWLYLTASAGAPTGVPATAPTGRFPIQYDSTNNKLWVYNGSWRGIVLV